MAWLEPPPLTHPQLARPDFTFDTVDWAAVVRGHLGRGDAEVDGSVLAAKAVDETYTLFDQVPGELPNAEGERHWNGLYLGAEKIWVGESVRLKFGRDTDVMVINDIIERIRPHFGSSGGGRRGGAGSSGDDPNLNLTDETTVTLYGDIYSLATIMPSMNGPVVVNQSLPPVDPKLPSRMKMDLQLWNFGGNPNSNAITTSSSSGPMGATRTMYHWKLIQAKMRLGLSDIKGRWYESSLLLDTLRGPVPTITNTISTSSGSGGTDSNGNTIMGGMEEIEDTGKYLNVRGVSLYPPNPPNTTSNTTTGPASTSTNTNMNNNQNSNITQIDLAGSNKMRREDAFGKSIPSETKINQGLDGPIAENRFPDEVMQAINQPARGHPVVGGTGHAPGGGAAGAHVSQGSAQGQSQGQPYATQNLSHYPSASSVPGGSGGGVGSIQDLGMHDFGNPSLGRHTPGAPPSSDGGFGVSGHGLGGFHAGTGAGGPFGPDSGMVGGGVGGSGDGGGVGNNGEGQGSRNAPGGGLDPSSSSSSSHHHHFTFGHFGQNPSLSPGMMGVSPLPSSTAAIPTSTTTTTTGGSTYLRGHDIGAAGAASPFATSRDVNLNLNSTSLDQLMDLDHAGGGGGGGDVGEMNW